MDSTALLKMINQKKAEINQSRRAKTLKPKVGSNAYRLLPGWRKTDDQFYHDFGQHFIKDVAGDMKAVYICVDKTFGRPCEICAGLSHATAHAAASGNDALKKALDGAKAASRILLNVLDVEGENPNVPQILEIGPSVFNGIIDVINVWGVEKTLGLEGGHVLIINREGAGLSTKYTVNISPEVVPVSKATMEKINNLDEYVAQESADNARRALSNLQMVAGLLPASVAAAPAAPAQFVRESLSAPVTAPTRAVAAAPVAVAAAPVVIDAVVSKPVIESSGDPEIDALLAGL